MSGSDLGFGFPAQDMTLHTHTNLVTQDRVMYWNYGLGDNDYGSFHFLMAGDSRSKALLFAVNKMVILISWNPTTIGIDPSMLGLKR